MLCRFDFKNKVIEFAPPFLPTDEERDFRRIYAYFEGVQGLIPANGFRPEVENLLPTELVARGWEEAMRVYDARRPANS